MPPVMLMSTPLAPFIDTSSSSGLEMAASAAFSARSSPSASPVPIIALPISLITVLMSAKSRLMRPGIMMRSVDAAHARMQHVVGHGEGLGEGGAVVGDAEQVLVRDDDQRVDIGLELFQAALGHPHALVAFEGEGLGDDADGEDAELAHRAGDDRGRAGAGAAAHAGGDEHHVRAFDLREDFFQRLFGAGAADVGAGAGAEALGHLHAHLNLALGLRLGERLRVGVGDDELHAFEPGGRSCC